MRRLAHLLLPVILIASCGSITPEEDLSAVFGPGEQLNFDHHCASEHRHFVLAWAVFSNEEAGALALARLDAGWISGMDPNGIGTTGVSVWLHRLRIARPPAGPDDALRLAFAVGGVRGGTADPRFFRDDAGALSMDGEDWTLAAQVENELAIPGAALRDDPQPQRIALVARSTETGEEIVLRGPHVADLIETMRLPEPEFQILGFFDILNPAQEGGLFDTIAHGIKYDVCIAIREGLIRKFEREVRDGNFDGSNW